MQNMNRKLEEKTSPKFTYLCIYEPEYIYISQYIHCNSRNALIWYFYVTTITSWYSRISNFWSYLQSERKMHSVVSIAIHLKNSNPLRINKLNRSIRNGRDGDMLTLYSEYSIDCAKSKHRITGAPCIVDTSEYQLLHFSGLWTWVSFYISLNFCFLMCKMGIITVPIS